MSFEQLQTSCFEIIDVVKDKNMSATDKINSIKEKFEYSLKFMSHKLNPQARVCIIKGEGDILLELREVESAVQIYKKLVRYIK